MPGRAHLAAIGLVVVAVVLIYSGVTAAGFCGYDDFNEAYRAVFFDAVDPRRIVTATHFTSFMYRPLTSALQLGTWDLSPRHALPFRVRNLAMHAVAIACTYGIAYLMSRSRAVATGAAVIFGLSPYANQAIVVAIWTNTTAYALLLGSFFFFVLALDRADRRAPLGLSLGASFVALALALFTYEPTIVGFGFMALFLGICRPRGTPRRFVVPFALWSVAVLGIFFGTRHVVGVGSAPLVAPADIARNLAEYVVALLMPVDPVLGNAVLHVPLPVSGVPFSPSLVLAPAAGFAVLALCFWAVRSRARPTAAAPPWQSLIFIACAIPVSLAPIVAFRGHVSEFNLYVAAALYAIGLAIAIRYFGRGTPALVAVLGLLAVFYASGDLARNVRVVACADVVQRILTSLPTGAWRAPARPVIRFATVSGARLSPPFGIYDYAGVQTLQVNASRIEGMQEALRLATGNEALDASVGDAAAFSGDCRGTFSCFTIAPDGAVRDVSRPNRNRS